MRDCSDVLLQCTCWSPDIVSPQCEIRQGVLAHRRWAPLKRDTNRTDEFNEFTELTSAKRPAKLIVASDVGAWALLGLVWSLIR